MPRGIPNTPLRQSFADPLEILALAEQEKEVLSIRTNSPVRYAPACEVLRQKGWTWKMIADWLAERNVFFSPNALSHASQRWGQSQEYIDWVASRKNDEDLNNVENL